MENSIQTTAQRHADRDHETGRVVRTIFTFREEKYGTSRGTLELRVSPVPRDPPPPDTTSVDTDVCWSHGLLYQRPTKTACHLHWTRVNGTRPHPQPLYRDHCLRRQPVTNDCLWERSQPPLNSPKLGCLCSRTRQRRRGHGRLFPSHRVGSLRTATQQLMR